MWYVHKVYTFPREWKINQSPVDPYAGDNAVQNFFQTSKEAYAEAAKRTKYEDELCMKAYLNSLK
jgi:hypothetical protein